MATPLTIRSTSDLLYSYQLSSAFRSPWVYSPSGFDLKEADAWEIVRNQTDMLAEINRRNNNIVRPWRVSPNHHASFNTKNKSTLDASKRLSAICHEGISHCGQLDEARTLLSEAFYLGRKYAYILWEPVVTSLDGSPEMTWYLPYKIKDLDRRRVHWVTDWEWLDANGQVVRSGSEYTTRDGMIAPQYTTPKGGYPRKKGLHLEIFNTDSWNWERLEPEMRRNLIEYIYYDSEDRVGHGRGVLEAGFFTHFLLTSTFKKIVEGIDRYANGVIVGKLDSLRNASTSKTNADILAAMKTVMSTFRSEHYVILGDGDDIKFEEPSGTGMNSALTFADHLIASWARLCNGSVRPAGHSVDGTGARAQASVEEDAGEAFYQNDRGGLDHVINRDLVGAFLYHNQENIVKLGLDKAKSPKFTSEQIKRQSPLDALQVLTGVVNLGQPVLKTEFFDKLELTPTYEGDDVVRREDLGLEALSGPEKLKHWSEMQKKMSAGPAETEDRQEDKDQPAPEK